MADKEEDRKRTEDKFVSQEGEMEFMSVEEINRTKALSPSYDDDDDDDDDLDLDDIDEDDLEEPDEDEDDEA